ncbi:MAG TPA: carboxypeptidase regulatory-like domain-containing protein [Thermoanaerobaculia bacterium]|nr:carboxypeptidase regulatory-like domain-containing protein [Thermoanaerobaculia bacterium]
MTMKKFLALPFAALVVFAIACGGGNSEKADEDDNEDNASTAASSTNATAAAPASAAAPAADAALVSGSVKLEGTAPAMSNIQMSADPTCQSQHTAPVKTQDVVAGPGGELANVLVYIKDFKGTVPPPSTSVQIDQKGCQYWPHVNAIQVGQTLEIKNSDPTLHNIHALAKENPEFNEGQPVQGMVSKKKFDKPEMMPIKIKCDVHQWMNSYMAVLPHPYFGVSDDKGNFSIKNLPPGTYTISAWHEKYGSQDQQITVGPKETKQISFTFKAS